MKSIDYIVSMLKDWEHKFPEIDICYSYEKDTEYHIITIDGNELYHDNPEYVNAEIKLWSEFAEMYPNEDILISEPKHSLEMKNIIYQTK